MKTAMELILAIALLIIGGSTGISLLLSTIQGITYEKKREKRDLEYHAERMKNLTDEQND
ncbi:hypothetical protein ACTQ32_11965 [Roseburia faecis]|uniref:hypothetical protein n=1 Tax=Roseburia faecis TaxID=301302 RepID=UPI003F9E221A